MTSRAVLSQLQLRDVDVRFRMFDDTPPGKDADSGSPTLRRYHQLLWNKPLPDGTQFTLTASGSRPYLVHESARGKFLFSSDAIVNTKGSIKKWPKELRDEASAEQNRALARIGSTIGCFTIFPSTKNGGTQTINSGRGFNSQIGDRFDLTLECIRRHDRREVSPLSEVMHRYADFFALFENFAGYVDFFLLEDLVPEDGHVRFYLPLESFDGDPHPADLDTYTHWCRRQALFVAARNKRIKQYVLADSTLPARVKIQARQWISDVAANRLAGFRASWQPARQEFSHLLSEDDGADDRRR